MALLRLVWYLCCFEVGRKFKLFSAGLMLTTRIPSPTADKTRLKIRLMLIDLGVDSTSCYISRPWASMSAHVLNTSITYRKIVRAYKYIPAPTKVLTSRTNSSPCSAPSYGLSFPVHYQAHYH